MLISSRSSDNCDMTDADNMPALLGWKSSMNYMLSMRILAKQPSIIPLSCTNTSIQMPSLSPAKSLRNFFGKRTVESHNPERPYTLRRMSDVSLRIRCLSNPLFTNLSTIADASASPDAAAPEYFRCCLGK